jgi:hypothetical protein
MAKSRIPHALQMRELKYGEADDAAKDQMAEGLRAAGRRAEAILLFEGRGDHPFLQEEVRWAVEEGNVFHLLSLRRLKAPVTAETLRACAAAAERKGRWMDARNAWLDLGDAEALARIAPHLPASLQPPPAATE